ncbi:MAG: efflux RND transporter periplasmic adaptor subunit [Candidatus Latescibacterota bacterium]
MRYSGRAGWALVGWLAVAVGCGSGQPASIRASGTIEGTEADLAARVPGLLSAVLVREGQAVDSAQVLARIDHVDLDWQLAAAQAAVRLAEANLEMAVNGPRAEDVEQAEAAVLQAQAAAEVARANQGRVRQLAGAGSATPRQLDEAEAQAKGAEAALAMAGARLAQLRAGTRHEQIQASQAQLEQARAQAGAVRQRIADCEVRAPFAGVVTHRLMEPGEMAGAGSAILTLTQLDPVRLEVYLTEVEVSRIRLGQPVEVYLDGHPQAPRPGRVVYISPTAEFTPKNVQTQEQRVKLVFGVEVELANADGALKPGLPADAVFVEDGHGAGH